MNYLLHCTLFIFLMFSGTSHTAQVVNYSIGDVVDDFTVTDVNGRVWNLYDITAQGEYVYFDFFFADGVSCQFTQSTFNEVYDKYGCNSGDLFFISINRGTKTNAEVIAYMEEFGGPFNHSPAIGIEGGCTVVTANFGIAGYPSYLLISPENVYLYRLGGVVTDITVEAFENSFPEGFNPEPTPCNLGVNDVGGAFDFSIVSNPSDGTHLSLMVDDFEMGAEVAIYNMFGQKIHSEVLMKATSDLKNLASGTYFVELKTQDSRTAKKLLVK